MCVWRGPEGHCDTVYFRKHDFHMMSPRVSSHPNINPACWPQWRFLSVHSDLRWRDSHQPPSAAASVRELVWGLASGRGGPWDVPSSGFYSSNNCQLSAGVLGSHNTLQVAEWIILKLLVCTAVKHQVPGVPVVPTPTLSLSVIVVPEH